MSDEVYSVLLAAIASQRLVLFTGAGLSMPAPSNLPSARELALQNAARHEALTGERLDDIHRENIEEQARLFWSRAALESYFLNKLIDWRPFNGEPNDGHYAVADFLLCGAADVSITTNLDTLVERAADTLGNPGLFPALNGAEAATPRVHQPLLKVHGCAQRSPESTLWCPEQLSAPEWQQRIATSTQWLEGRLIQRDLVFVGYWTDWAYLQDALIAVVADQAPRSVTLVDPASQEALAAKAPKLWEWAHRDGIVFFHVRESGSAFLSELRRRFSHVLLKRIALTGQSAFQDPNGESCPPFPPTTDISAAELYDLRRDWTGVRRDRVSFRREELTSDELLGKVFFELLAKGGQLQGSALVLGRHRIRLVNGAGRMLYSLKAELAGDVAQFEAPDITICAGAHDDGGVPADIVRADRGSTIIRPGVSGRWYTHATMSELVDEA